jgi:hypothetical protein
VRVNATEARGRTTGEILKHGLETFDFLKTQMQCEQSAPMLWKLLERISTSGLKTKNMAAVTSPEAPSESPTKRRKTDLGSISSGGHNSNPPLTVVMMLLLVASSQVRNKFQKWFGLYLYAQGARKGPLNSLRTLGLASEGKVIGDNGISPTRRDRLVVCRLTLCSSASYCRGHQEESSR